MSEPTARQVLGLYKNLLRYGKELKYTDQQYYYERIKQEFLNSRNVSGAEAKFQYEVCV